MTTHSVLSWSLRLAGAGLCLACVARPLAAAPPVHPLPPPNYSFDPASPAVLGGVVGAADILAFGHPHPVVAVPAAALGLGFDDDLDGISAGYLDTMPPQSMALLFSVDRTTMGSAPPDLELVLLGVPFNALDQAARGHAAGDQYMSLTRFGGFGRAEQRSANNTLVRNNFDEGGTSFSADPPVPAYGSNSPRTMQDNVDAAAVLERQPVPGGQIVHVYFTVTASSPYTLPGYDPSGARIYFNVHPGVQPTRLYADAAQLQLQPADDIDAVRVFDANGNGHYDVGDSVLFSLTPGSPTLGAFPDATGAAVVLARPGAPLTVFAPGGVLGLGGPLDNIDALDFFICDDGDGTVCGAERGIRLLRGDLNCSGEVDFDDINPFVLALSDPALYAAAFPECHIMHGDFNGDGAVDFADINPFVAALATPKGACCKNGECFADTSPSECLGIEGQWLGPGVLCDSSPCPLPPCVVECPPNGNAEQEPCGADTNGGCSTPGTLFELLPGCSVRVCGTAWFDGTIRDTDWYELDLGSPAMVTVAGRGEAEMVFGWVEQITPGVPGCGNITGYLSPYFIAPACVEGGYLTVCLPAGTYYVFAATTFAHPAACPVDYVMTVTCEPCPPPISACCVNGVCVGDLEAPACVALGGVWFEGETCATFFCPSTPWNDECQSAQPVLLPYPVTVLGTCVGATVDCPDVLGWSAVWYQVELPHTSNKLGVRYCGTQTGIWTVGIVYYTMCDDCLNYTVVSGYAWNDCSAGNAAGVDVWWDQVPGPGYVYVPAYLVGPDGQPMEFLATFDVLSQADGARDGATGSEVHLGPTLSR